MALLMLIIVLLLCGAGFGQVSVGLSGGYANMQPTNYNTDGINGTPYRFPRSGAYIDGDFAVHVAQSPFPLLLGGGVSWTGAESSGPPQLDIFSLSPYMATTFTLDSRINQYALEARAAVPLFFSGSHGFFIEPKIGAGLLAFYFSGDRTNTGTEASPFEQKGHWQGYAFEVRPGVEIGYTWQHIAVGVEGSCMLGWGSFHPFGNTELELRAGAFLRFSF